MTSVPFDLRVALALGFSAVLAIVLPFAIAFVLRRRTGASWRDFFIGAAIFVVFQLVLRLPWQIPLGLWVHERFRDNPRMMFAFLVFSALTASLFEELGRFFVFRGFVKEKSARAAAMLGTGHGGIESVLFAGLGALNLLVVYVLFTHGVALPIPADKLPQVTEQLQKLTPLLALAGGIERIFAMTAHIGFALLVMRTVATRRWQYLGIALAGHFALDLFAGWSAKRLPIWGTEALVAVVAASILALGIRVWRAPNENAADLSGRGAS